jgi:hypothetical protein
MSPTERAVVSTDTEKERERERERKRHGWRKRRTISPLIVNVTLRVLDLLHGVDRPSVLFALLLETLGEGKGVLDLGDLVKVLRVGQAESTHAKGVTRFLLEKEEKAPLIKKDRVFLL